MSNQSNFNERVFNGLEKTNTNWSVHKKPLISTDHFPTGSYGLFRSDNNQWLGTVKSRYCEYQNAEMLELLMQTTDSMKLSVTSGGVLQQGRKVFYQIALPDAVIGKSGMKRYVTAINSHDGSSSIGLGSSNTVIVCQNTFFKVHREIQRVTHTSLAKERLRVMADQLTFAIQRDEVLVETFKRMSETDLTEQMIEGVVNKLFRIEARKAKQKDVSTRTLNNIKVFSGNILTEVGIHGNTVWSLFNAVTRYTTHHASPTTDSKRLDYLMKGEGARLSNLAFNELMQYVDAHLADDALVLV